MSIFQVEAQGYILQRAFVFVDASSEDEAHEKAAAMFANEPAAAIWIMWKDVDNTVRDIEVQEKILDVTDRVSEGHKRNLATEGGITAIHPKSAFS